MYPTHCISILGGVTPIYRHGARTSGVNILQYALSNRCRGHDVFVEFGEGLLSFSGFEVSFS